MVDRIPIKKSIRFEVFKRDSFTCQYCGKSAPQVVLHVDHIHPVSKGGEQEDITNLITACVDCNLGKGARELTDQQAVEKKKKQLDELQERREQLEMMLDWQNSLVDMGQQEIDACESFWLNLTNYSFTDIGEKTIRKNIKRFGLSETMECMRISVEQYLIRDQDGKCTDESVHKAFDYVVRIAANRQTIAKKPYMKELYYIRGILRHRGFYVNEWQAIEYLEKAYLAGVDTEELKQMTMESKHWSDWRDTICNYTQAWKDLNNDQTPQP